MTGLLRWLFVGASRPGRFVTQPSALPPGELLLEAHYALTDARGVLVRIRAGAVASERDYQAALRDPDLPEGQLDDAQVIAAAAIVWLGETVDNLNAFSDSDASMGGR